MSITVMLVDDDAMALMALRTIIGHSSDCVVVAEASSGEQALTTIRRTPVDVVLLDLRMPGMGGIATIERLQSFPKPPPVVVMTTWDVDDAVGSALDAGAAGFLLKASSPSEILQAIRSVVAGDAVLSPRSTRRLLDLLGRDTALQQRREAQKTIAQLTDREREVAHWVGLGLTNDQIGEKLFLASATVKSHIATIQTKLGVPNRVRIAVLADRAGLLSSPTP